MRVKLLKKIRRRYAIVVDDNKKVVEVLDLKEKRGFFPLGWEVCHSPHSIYTLTVYAVMRLTLGETRYQSLNAKRSQRRRERRRQQEYQKSLNQFINNKNHTNDKNNNPSGPNTEIPTT